MRSTIATAMGLVAAMVLAWSLPVSADPPAHAPAHGWRAKNKAHRGHSGYEWELDYGILSGNCDRQKIATVVGGIAGGVIANRVAEPENRMVATLIGAAAGALIGNRIGKRLDEADEACFGHALELGGTGQTVSWTNESTGVDYRLVPGADTRRDGAPCREFSLRAAAGSEKSTTRGLACQSERGFWQVVR